MVVDASSADGCLMRYVSIGLIIVAAAALSGCGKIGGGGILNQMVGNWAEVRLPDGCKAKLIAGEEKGGAIVLCEDGRLFH